MVLHTDGTTATGNSFTAVDVRVGNNYGTDVNMIVPITEKNNPSFTGCLDRKA